MGLSTNQTAWSDSLSIHLFSKTFFFNSNCILKILGHIYLLWHKPIAAPFIQMLFGQQVLDMAYFGHYHYYGHLRSITKIYNPEETCCWSASAKIKSNIGLKWWPCRCTASSATIRPISPSTPILHPFLWISDVFQMANVLDTDVRHEWYC